MTVTSSPPAAGSPRAASSRTTEPLPLTRGRRVALAIGVPVCLLLVAGVGLNLVATFGEGKYPVSYTASPAAKSLSVTLDSGQVSIGEVSSGPATLTGTATYSLIHSTFTARTSGDAAKVSYDCAITIGNCNLDAAVSVPPALPVTASTNGGDIHVTGTTSPVTLSSGGGDLSADRTSGSLVLSTDGGNINGTAITSTAVTASTGGGDITIAFAGLPSNVRVSTSGGNITLILPPGQTPYDVTTSTDGGRPAVDVPQVPGAKRKISASTGGGDITILRR